MIRNKNNKEDISTNYENATLDYKKTLEQIESIKKKINALPDGKLICSHSRNHCKWYISDGHEKTYIPKANRELAEHLAIKKYYSLRLKYLENEKTAMEFYLNHKLDNDIESEALLNDSIGYGELLSPFFKPLSSELQEWANESYERNLSYPENLIHKTGSGHIVRSKSEALIDTCLYKSKIPFRYECALRLGESTIFPDFTIRHPKTGEVYYWEHFGRADDLNYVRNTCSKLQLYMSNGIVPNIQLITTYETKKHPLNSEEIEQIIEHFFLTC